MAFRNGGDTEEKTWIIKSECLFLLMILRSLSMSKEQSHGWRNSIHYGVKRAILIITIKYETIIKDRRH